MSIRPVLFTQEEEENGPDSGPCIPRTARALLVPFPDSGEDRKHLPTSDCEQGEMLELTPPVPCKENKGERMARVSISVLKSWLEKKLCTFKEKNEKVWQIQDKQSGIFPFFFVFVHLCCYKFDRHCRREKMYDQHRIGTTLFNLLVLMLNPWYLQTWQVRRYPNSPQPSLHLGKVL